MQDWLDDVTTEDNEDIDALLGRLWHSTDILPLGYCQQLDLPQGSSYAAAAQKIAAERRQPSTKVALHRHEASGDELFERLVAADIPAGLTRFDVVAAYMRATMVAAELSYDQDFFQSMLIRLAEKSREQELCGSSRNSGENAENMNYSDHLGLAAEHVELALDLTEDHREQNMLSDMLFQLQTLLSEEQDEDDEEDADEP